MNTKQPKIKIVKKVKFFVTSGFNPKMITKKKKKKRVISSKRSRLYDNINK